MRIAPRSEPIRAILEVRFEDWLDDLHHRCLHDSILDHRYSQWSQFPVGLRYVFSPYWRGFVLPCLEFVVEFLHKALFTYNFIDSSKRHPVYPWRSIVGPYLAVSCPSRLFVDDLVIQTVEAKSLLLFSFPTELLSQSLNSRRQHRFAHAQLGYLLFCRRYFHCQSGPTLSDSASS